MTLYIIVRSSFLITLAKQLIKMAHIKVPFKKFLDLTYNIKVV